MKRIVLAALATVLALAVGSAPAYAVLRVPQVPFASAPLQTRLNAAGESINVLTQQQNGLVWGTTATGNSLLTIQFDLNNGNLGDSEMGIAKLDPTGHSITGYATVFPATADNGWFAVASFKAGDLLTVNLFNQNAVLVNPVPMQYTGVNRSLFAYYLKTGLNTFYSHDGFNSDGRCHALTYAGTGQNAGCWWQCWENAPITNYSGADFNDAVVFMEALNPTPVSHATWGSVKARFR